MEGTHCPIEFATMSAAQVISIATQFTRYPAGRYSDDGPYSGTAFRENWLVPAMNSGVPFTVDLDGVRGYGSSFLEEAFGGLVRGGIPAESVHKLLRLKSVDQTLIEEIWEYVDHAGERA
ncbi:STAS-like domain-containing protein [Pandoraea apista]|uniref:STAS-like domain-containing protein n=1 Tax=Pandoraea apista TaxID=93218 RepID=UPI0039DFEE94